MRLTLRTLLAYLDDRLSPADTEELGRRIAESSFASGLVHRIRSCTRRLRLGAPSLDARGLGGDPNTVAEYLDNTLSQDRVGALEKICLESELHLSEVASCHQILTLVVEEPCDVSPALRARIHALGHGSGGAGDSAGGRGGDGGASGGQEVGGGQEASAAASSQRARSAGGSAGGVSDAQAGELQPARTSRRLEVPDYLRQPERRPVSLTRRIGLPLLGVVSLAVGAAVGLMLLGPWASKSVLVDGDAGDGTSISRPGEEQPVTGITEPVDVRVEGAVEAVEVVQEGGVLQQVPGVEGQAQAGTEPDLGRAGPLDPPESGEAGAAGAGVAESFDPPEAGRVSGVGQEADRERAAGVERAAPAPVPGLAGSGPEDPVGGGLAGTTEVPERGVPERGVPEAVRPAAGQNTASVRGVIPGPLPVEPGRALFPQPGDSPQLPPGGGVSQSADAAVELGRYSESQLLVRWEPRDSQWVRVPPNATLYAGDRLQALPTYRPQLVLVPGVQVTFAGHATVQLNPAPVAEMAELGIGEGRVLLLPVGSVGTRLALNLGGRRGWVTFLQADSGLAVEVQRYLPPGANPETDPAWRIAQLFVTAGRVRWDPADGDAAAGRVLRAGHVLVLVDEQPGRVELFDPAPAWVDPRQDLSALDRKTSAALEPLIPLDRPLGLSLLELTEHRQTDIRALAARCLASLDQFDALVKQFGQERQKAYWGSAFEAMRQSMQGGPNHARQLREAWERADPERSALLYRLSRGYGPLQLEQGDAEQLVEYLEHESMVVRILASENLKWITGGVTHSFRPEEPVESERAKVIRWRQRLQDGAIRYAEPPEPLPRRPAAF